MLVISAEQMKVFEQKALSSFETEMVKHLFSFAPRHCEVIGEDGVREVVRLGIYKSKNFGLTNRGPVRLYIEMMFIFGSSFDTDPQVPWAAEILNNSDIKDQMERGDLLYRETLHYLDEVAGPDREYAVKALREVALVARQPLALSSEKFSNDILRQLHRIYPQKCVYIGDDCLRTLILSGINEAGEYGVSSVRSVALLVALMFAIGHGCAGDPLYPWIERTLKAPNIVDSANRMKRLEAKALVYLEHGLQAGRA